MTAHQDEAHKDPAGDQRLDAVVVGGSHAVTSKENIIPLS